MLPSSVRLSANTTMSPSCSSLVITGSRLEIASISPFFTAATAVALAPTRMNAASSALRPAFTMRYMTKKLVEEPGAVTPILKPFRSAKDFTLAALSFFTPSTMPGKRPSSITALMSWPLACMRMRCS